MASSSASTTMDPRSSLPQARGILSLNNDNVISALHRIDLESEIFLKPLVDMTHAFRARLGLPPVAEPKVEPVEGNLSTVQSTVKRGRKRVRARDEEKRIVINRNRLMPVSTATKAKKARSEKMCSNITNNKKKDEFEFAELMTELSIDDHNSVMLASKSSIEKHQTTDNTVVNETMNTRSTRARTRAAAHASRVNATMMNTPSKTVVAVAKTNSIQKNTPRSRVPKMTNSTTKATKASKDNLTGSVSKIKQNSGAVKHTAQSKDIASVINATPNKIVPNGKANPVTNNSAANNTPAKVVPATPRRKAELDAKFKEKLIMSEDKSRKAIEKKEQLLSNRQQTLRERAACRQKKLEEFQRKQKEEQQQKLESMQKKMQVTPTRQPRKAAPRAKKDEELSHDTPSKRLPKAVSNDSLSKNKLTASARKEQSHKASTGKKAGTNLTRNDSSSKLNIADGKKATTLTRNQSNSKLKVAKDGDSSSSIKSNGPKKPPRAGNSKKNLKAEPAVVMPPPSPICLSPIAKSTNIANSTFVAADHEDGVNVTTTVGPMAQLNSTFPVPPSGNTTKDHVFQVPAVPAITPAKNPNLSKLEQSINSYQMTPPRPDYESQYDLTQAFDSEDEEAAEAADRARGFKKIPSWAQGKEFIVTIRTQFSKPPEELDRIARAAFGQIRLPVPLEEMGLSLKEKYTKRSSSVYWDQDKLTSLAI